MGNYAFNARRLKDNVGGHAVAATSTTDLSSSCSTSSPYTSSRIQSMLESRSNFPDKTAFAIECSKVHWSQLDHPSDSNDRYSPESDRLYFDEVLKKHSAWGRFCFFRDFDDLEIMFKLAKGGQGDVYYARRTRYGGEYAVKVFNEGVPLRRLLQQMPPSMLSGAEFDFQRSPLRFILGVTMLKDHRFKNRVAFVMECQRCDLRKLIDDQMMSKGNQGPPFTMGLTIKFFHKIAKDMVFLQDQCGIIHKDLKASNVLVTVHPAMILYEDVRFGTEPVFVTDFESSEIGVLGTGFWRAPEILHRLKNGDVSPLHFTKQCDVYSFAMVAYELVTGRLPFEDLAPDDYDVVLSGGRPELPEGMEPSLKQIITECWHPQPSERPDFLHLENRLRMLLSRYEREAWVNAKYGSPDTYCKENNIEYP